MVDQPVIDFRSTYPGPERYIPRRFSEVYAEAKRLRSEHAKIAAGFIVLFLALYFVGAGADIVERVRRDPESWKPMLDSIQFGSQWIKIEKALEEPPTFFDLLSLKVIAAMGTTAFFVFASAVIAEIAFRHYEGRETDSSELVDSLTRTHGVELLRLSGFFMLVMLSLGVVDMATFELPWGGVFYLLAVILYFVILLRTAFAVQGIIGEDLPVRTAIARSLDLTRGNVWRMFGWCLLFYLILLATLFLYSLPALFFLFLVVGFGGGEILSAIFGIALLVWFARPMSLIFFFQMAMYREFRLRLNEEDPTAALVT